MLRYLWNIITRRNRVCRYLGVSGLSAEQRTYLLLFQDGDNLKGRGEHR
jgi:hypothetical protein